MASPIGPVELVVADGILVHLAFADGGDRQGRQLTRRFGARPVEAGDAPAGLVQALALYFEGATAALRELPCDPDGTTFQRRVWHALRAIPPGATRTYAGLAAVLGLGVSASRAVGAAVGANPVSLVIPCHRVVGSDGSLTGYAGGLDRKRWLLAHEAASV
mgnify:CR=1 FL=1